MSQKCSCLSPSRREKNWTNSFSLPKLFHNIKSRVWLGFKLLTTFFFVDFFFTSTNHLKELQGEVRSVVIFLAFISTSFKQVHGFSHQLLWLIIIILILGPYLISDKIITEAHPEHSQTLKMELFANFLLWAINSFYRETVPKTKFSIKDFLSKCDQIWNFLWIWSHLLKKSLTENFIFCAVKILCCYGCASVMLQLETNNCEWFY